MSKVAIGNTATYKTNFALVVVTGNVCVRLPTTVGHPPKSPLCFTNTDKSQGLPTSDAAFPAAFAASPNIFVGTTACIRANGQWLVSILHQIPRKSTG